jgi:hypothetical protein
MAGPRVLIIGAGLAGLGAALSLKQSGVEDVTVFEQANRLEDIQLGNGMIIWPNSVKALQELGVEQKLNEFANSVRTVEVFEPKGRRLSTWDMSDIQQRVGAGTRCFVRGAAQLLTTALAEIDANALELGKRVVGLDQDAEGVSITFADGGVERGDILVCADGLLRRPGDRSPGSGGPSSRPTSTRRGTESFRSPIARRFRMARSTWCSGQGFGSTSIEPRTRASVTAATGGAQLRPRARVRSRRDQSLPGRGARRIHATGRRSRRRDSRGRHPALHLLRRQSPAELGRGTHHSSAMPRTP